MRVQIEKPFSGDKTERIVIQVWRGSQNIRDIVLAHTNTTTSIELNEGEYLVVTGEKV